MDISSDSALCNQIKDVIEFIRPRFLAHGGDLSFVRFEEGVVYVQLAGACIGCPSSRSSIKNMIEAELRREIPQVERVEAVE
ncbi:NifU family protein [Candidatus Babeliales bacterium]|nr:NifU family protein [Candidatus Babeliales bacterium]